MEFAAHACRNPWHTWTQGALAGQEHLRHRKAGRSITTLRLVRLGEEALCYSLCGLDK